MRIWIGYHDRAGIVIYDPRSQAGIGDPNVRLWMVSDQELKLFSKSAVRPHLISLEKHLLNSGLSPLVQQHGIVRQVAKRYLISHPISKIVLPSYSEESIILITAMQFRTTR